MAGETILVADDEELLRDSLRLTLERAGYRVVTAASGEEALERASRAAFDLVISDLRMDGLSGVELLARLRARGTDVPVVLITAYGTVESAVAAMKQGAHDFLTKPFSPDQIEVTVARALEHRRLETENESLRAALDAGEGGGARHELVSPKSAVFRRVLEQAAKVADSDATLLLVGPSGSGKEVVARAIHRQGRRAARPFVATNCAALAAGLLESELFGHEKGAFTGADAARRGRFELAEGGTLLLDEVSEIGTGLQAKLLRVLQEREFERVGSSLARRADVRVIATTNRDLPRAVREGRFREDLYYRLAVVTIELPPLAARREDVPDLARAFAGRHSRRRGGAPIEVEPEALEAMAAYDWPGNVRELENAVERALILGDGQRLRAADLALGRAVLQPAAASLQPLEDVERTHILTTLEQCGGKKSEAARILRVTERTLRNKLQRWQAEGKLLPAGGRNGPPGGQEPEDGAGGGG